MLFFQFRKNRCGANDIANRAKFDNQNAFWRRVIIRAALAMNAVLFVGHTRNIAAEVAAISVNEHFLKNVLLILEIVRWDAR